MLVWKVTALTQELYGEGEGADFAVDCPYCTGAIQAKADMSIGRSNVPFIFSKASIDDFKWEMYPNDNGKTEKIKEYVRGFLINYKKVKKDGIGFYITSKAKGAGKTMLACCVLNTLIKRYGIIGKFVPSYALIDATQNPTKYAATFGNDPMRTFTTCEVLVIDDIGQKVSGNDWLNDLIYQISNERMQKGLITIYTSNYQPETLPYDGRVKDRITSTTQTINIPDVCVRHDEAIQSKRDRFNDFGIKG